MSAPTILAEGRCEGGPVGSSELWGPYRLRTSSPGSGTPQIPCDSGFLCTRSRKPAAGSCFPVCCLTFSRSRAAVERGTRRLDKGPRAVFPRLSWGGNTRTPVHTHGFAHTGTHQFTRTPSHLPHVCASHTPSHSPHVPAHTPMCAHTHKHAHTCTHALWGRLGS